jgi:hypothetical protein
MTQMTSFRYQEGFHAPRGLSAETAAIALDDVRKSCGALTAENVVNAARAKENPLHKAFEWNDNTAAEKYRLQQANQLIRCVVIIEQNEEPYRYFTLAGDKTTKATYLPTSMVISRPDLLQDGLLRLKRELAGSLRSVEELMRVATKNNPSAAKKLAAVKKTLERANDLLG